MADKPTLSIITVTYNSAKYLPSLIESVKKYAPKSKEFIIVDSGSRDDSVDIIKKHPWVQCIEAKENIGFGKGSNKGAKQARGEYLLFLNPDTKLEDTSIDQLLQFVRHQEQVGIVAPKLVQDDGTAQPSVRNGPTIWRAFQEYYLGQKNVYEAYVPKGKSAVEVESVVGAGILIKKELFDQIGGFDEKYFMYFEDLELCRQVRKRGLKIFYLPQTAIKHSVGGSYSALKQQWLKQSARAYHGAFQEAMLDLVLRLRPRK